MQQDEYNESLLGKLNGLPDDGEESKHDDFE